MICGLEQEGGSLIAPMALAHPLHPIDNRSRNNRRLDDVFPPDDLGSRPEALYIYIYMCIPYMSSVIGRVYIYNGSVIQYWRSCTPSRSIGLYFWGVHGYWAECHFLLSLVTNCVLLFDKSLILGCLWPLVFVLNNTLILGIRCSTIPHLPGCFWPWTFIENIGFNTALTDPFMSHIATQLGFAAGEFQALQLRNHLPPACWSTVWKSNCQQQLGCRFNIMDNISYFLCFDMCNYICLDTSDPFSVLPS